MSRLSGTDASEIFPFEGKVEQVRAERSVGFWPPAGVPQIVRKVRFCVRGGRELLVAQRC